MFGTPAPLASTVFIAFSAAFKADLPSAVR
jgi:hypothetical protein